MITASSKIEILQRMREVLSKPNAWIKGSYARDADGALVYPESPRAVSWCLLGCLKKETCGYKEWEEEIRFDIANTIHHHTKSGIGITTFNDQMDMEVDTVLKVIDDTIEIIHLRDVEPPE